MNIKGLIYLNNLMSEIEWRVVTVSTPEAIKGLLKFRSDFDPTYTFSENSMMLREETAYNINYEAIDTYVTLDKHMKRANLTERQKEVLKLYQTGMTEREMSEILKISHQATNKLIDTICERIHREYIENWKDYIFLNVVKTPYEYKQCTRCEEFKPKTNEYFYIEPKGKDGFKKICIKCH